MNSVHEKNEVRYVINGNNRVLSSGNDYSLPSIADLPEQEKPREKLLAVGPHNLSLAELIALLIVTGRNGENKEDVLALSHRIVREYGEKAILQEVDAKRLAEALSIGKVKAMQLIAAFEIGRRFFARKSGKPAFIRNSSQAYEYLKDMAFSKKEQLRGLYLNSRHELIHDEVISVGSLTANIVHPREVFQPALEHSAVAIIVAHNHPSGDTKPTPPDIAITEQLQKAGEALGISLLDHLIITENSYNSILLKEHLL